MRRSPAGWGGGQRGLPSSWRTLAPGGAPPHPAPRCRTASRGQDHKAGLGELCRGRGGRGEALFLGTVGFLRPEAASAKLDFSESALAQASPPWGLTFCHTRASPPHPSASPRAAGLWISLRKGVSIRLYKTKEGPASPWQGAPPRRACSWRARTGRGWASPVQLGRKGSSRARPSTGEAFETRRRAPILRAAARQEKPGSRRLRGREPAPCSLPRSGWTLGLPRWC